MDDATDNDDHSIDSLDVMYDDTLDICCLTCLTAKWNALHKFCMALPSNLVFSTGFDLVSKEWDRPILSDKCFNYCYCPCSRKMSEWQGKFNIDLQHNICSKNVKCTPFGLLDHIGSYDDMYHRAVKFYLENLYTEVLEETKQGRKASHGIKWEKHVCS